MDAQQQQEELLNKTRDALMRLPPSRMKREIEASGGVNASTSSSEKSSLPTDLVDQVMKRHGFTREEEL